MQDLECATREYSSISILVSKWCNNKLIMPSFSHWPASSTEYLNYSLERYSTLYVGGISDLFRSHHSQAILPATSSHFTPSACSDIAS